MPPIKGERGHEILKFQKKNLDPGSILDQKLNKNRSSSTKCLSQVQKHEAKEIKEQEKHIIP